MRTSIVIVASILIVPTIVQSLCIDFITNGSNADCLVGFGVFSALSGLLLALGIKASQPPPPTVTVIPANSNRRPRGKRSAQENAEAFNYLEFAFNELDQSDCYKRLVCEVAAGADYNASKGLLEMIDIANNEVNLPYTIKMVLTKLNTSARVGKVSTQSIQNCQKVYSQCPLSGAQVNELVALGLA